MITMKMCTFYLAHRINQFRNCESIFMNSLTNLIVFEEKNLKIQTSKSNNLSSLIILIFEIGVGSNEQHDFDRDAIKVDCGCHRKF